MKRKASSRISGGLALLGLVAAVAAAQAPATTPAVLTVLGHIETVDASTRTVTMKLADGATVTVALAEKGSVVKVAPGETSLQNAAPIAFNAITAGDRVMVRGGTRAESRIEGALRVVVMAKTDLTARNDAEQRAWRERGVAGTVISADAANAQFILQTSVPPATPAASLGATPPGPSNTVVVEAKNAAIHRYADTSVKFDDARPATVADMAAADQVRVLGTRSADGLKLTAERVVFGSFSTKALAIEKIDAATGVISVKDLQSNQKFTISVVPGGTIRRIPAEMAAMFGAMSGGGASGRPGMNGGMGASGARPEGGRPGGAGGMGAGAGTGTGSGAPGAPGAPGMGGRPGGAGGRRGGMEDMVERMPAITLADLKKDDWVGAVVGRIDASGKAVAFNMLAGIEVFAARANRSGGVDVGMPAGLLDGGMGMQ